MLALVNAFAHALKVRPLVAALVLAGSLSLTAFVVGLGTAAGLLEYMVLMVVAAVFVFVSTRTPLIALLVYVALLSLEGIVLIEQVATLPRVAGIALAVSYLLSRLLLLRLGVIPLAGWAFVGWAGASVLWAVDPETALAGVTRLVQLFVVALLVADMVSKDPSVVRWVMWTYSLVAILVAVVGIQNFLIQSPELLAGRATAFGGGVAWFAASLMPAFIFLLYASLRQGLQPGLTLAGAFVCGLGILVSGTRSVWLAVVVAVALTLLPRIGMKQRIAALCCLSAMVVVGLQVPGVLAAVTSRTESAVETGGAGRLEIWQVGLTLLASYPVVGAGYGNFPVVLTPDRMRAASPALRLQEVSTVISPHVHNSVVMLGNEERYVVYVPTDSAEEIPRGFGSHNIYLGTLAELGPLGLGLLLWFLTAIIRRPAPHPYGPMLQAAVVAFLVQGFFLDLLFFKPVWLVIALALGLLYRPHALVTHSTVPPAGARERVGAPIPLG